MKTATMTRSRRRRRDGGVVKTMAQTGANSANPVRPAIIHRNGQYNSNQGNQREALIIVTISKGVIYPANHQG